MKTALHSIKFSLLLALFLVFALPNLSYARLLCRSDPVVKLSNGITLNLIAYVAADSSQILEIHYDLHVPVGTSLTHITPTSAMKSGLETFTLYADQAAGKYQVITTVHTTLRNADVTVSAKVHAATTYEVSGKEDSALVLQFSG